MSLGLKINSQRERERERERERFFSGIKKKKLYSLSNVDHKGYNVEILGLLEFNYLSKVNI